MKGKKRKIEEKKHHASYAAPLVPRSVSGVCSVRLWWYHCPTDCNRIIDTDGGISWQRSLINDPRVSLVDVPHFINMKQGWLEISSTPGAGSAGSDIWHSNDGGQTWSKLSSNKSSSGLNLGYLTGLSFRNAHRNAQVGITAGNLGAGEDNTVPSLPHAKWWTDMANQIVTALAGRVC